MGYVDGDFAMAWVWWGGIGLLVGRRLHAFAENWGAERQAKYLRLLEQGRDEIRRDPFTLGSRGGDDFVEGCLKGVEFIR